MTCEAVRPLLLDLALGAPLADEAAAHVETCADCGAALESERRHVGSLDAALRVGLAVTPSPGFVAGARRRAAARRGDAGAWRWQAAAAVLLVLGAAFLVARRDVEETRVSAGPAAPSAPARARLVPARPAPAPDASAPAAGVTPGPSPRRPRPRPAAPRDPRFQVLVSPDEERALRLLIERMESRPDEPLGRGLRVSDAAETLVTPIPHLPPMVITPLPRSDS